MAKPNLALIPATIGNKVYSILPSDGVGDFDFTRASTATRINAQGLIETVASGENRLNYSLLDGEVVGCPHLLLEDEATNLITYSEDFSNGSWNTARIETPYIADVVSPDGTLNAYTLEISSGETGGGGVYKTGISITGDNSYSVFAKKKTADYLVLSDTGTTSNAVYFNLENGTVGTEYNATGQIEYFGNGWYRCTMKYNLTSSGLKFIYISDIDGQTTNGVQGGDSIYIWGAMLEQGSYPTSYIPTDGNAVTRSAETATGSGDAATFNDSEGVLMAEISALDNNVTDYNSIGLGNNSAFNRIGLGFETPNNIYVYKHDGSNSWLPSQKIDINLFNKVALSYKTNDNHFWVNGFKLASNTSVGDANPLTELEFRAPFGSEDFYGKTKQLQYFDSADIDLETLTSWDSFRAMAEGQLYTIE